MYVYDICICVCVCNISSTPRVRFPTYFTSAQTHGKKKSSCHESLQTLRLRTTFGLQFEAKKMPHFGASSRNGQR